MYFHVTPSTPVIPAMPEAEVRGLGLRMAPSISWKLYLKNKLKAKKRSGSVTQVIERLPSNCKSLSSNPSTTKN
jgi:hypothetical protein